MDVYDDAIMPGSTYELDTILNATECKVTEEYGFSEPVAILTASEWGDVVGDCDVTPCTVPDGVVDFEDITAVVEKFRNEPGAPIKSRADLINSDVTNPEPDRKVDFVDITFCVDAFRGFEQHPNPYLGPDPDDYCPYVGDCYADIRVDSNNDGVINVFDDTLEDAVAVQVSANGDDDNFNGYPDMYEAPVEGEDDLAEMQLSSSCVPPVPDWAFWSISLDPPSAPIQMWTRPDKSDGAGGPGSPINAGEENDWPPPEVLWLEFVDTIEEVTITLRLNDGLTAKRSVGPHRPFTAKGELGWGEVLDMIMALASCTHQYMYAGHCAYVANLPNTTGIIGGSVWLDTLDTTLCGEPYAKAESHSIAYVSVDYEISPGPGGNQNAKWAQTGYGLERRNWDTEIALMTYAETKGGYEAADYDMEFGPAPEYETQFYMTWINVLTGQVLYWGVEEGAPWYNFQHDYFIGRNGQHIAWYGELCSRQDRLLGRYEERMRFDECKYRDQANTERAIDLEHPSAEVRNTEETFGINILDSDAFEIWDPRG